MSLDLFPYFLSQFISVHIPDHFFHIVPESLGSRAFHNECSRGTNQVSTENHIKGNINHDKYHFSDIDGMNVTVTCRQKENNSASVFSEQQDSRKKKLTNSRHSDNCEVQRCYITLGKINIPEIRVTGAPQR
jgi:hypothetical protein